MMIGSFYLAAGGDGIASRGGKEFCNLFLSAGGLWRRHPHKAKDPGRGKSSGLGMAAWL